MTENIPTDHDLVIRIDENVKNLINEVRDFKTSTSSLATVFESRLRLCEENITRLAPIPSVSHQAVVNDIASLTNRVEKIEKKETFLYGGWKALVIISGIIIILIKLFISKSI